MGLARCCARFLRILVFLIDVLLLLVGLGYIAVGVVLKQESIFRFAGEDTASKLIASWDSLSTFFVVIGAFLFVASVVGVLCVCCSNRVVLVVYEVVALLLFLAHLATFIYFATRRDQFEKDVDKIVQDLRQKITDSLPVIPDGLTAEQRPDIDCQGYNELSSRLECCDLTQEELGVIGHCCPVKNSKTCSKAIANLAYDFIVILPNSVLIGLEFIVIVSMVFLIIQATRSLKKKAVYLTK